MKRYMYIYLDSQWASNAAARGIVLKYNPSMLAELGGPVDLNQYWVHSLLVSSFQQLV